MMLNRFLEMASMLREEMGIIPLLYGSLGLSYLTREPLCPDDIDMLLPKACLNNDWYAFKSVLEKHGYQLTDEQEHTFVKDGVRYAFADIEELESFAGICMPEIAVREENGVQFLLLSLSQYLRVYQASSKDGYRIHVREKKDQEKIELIERHLS